MERNSEYFYGTPPEVPVISAENKQLWTTNETANEGTSLTERSQVAYKVAFDKFQRWCVEKQADGYSETVLLEYFIEKAKQRKSSTLWGEYSMIKKSLFVIENVDISKYDNLKAFLKKISVGYQPKQSKIFTKEEFNRYISEAPDSEHLFKKVVAIIGIAGACSREELMNLCVQDIEDHNSHLLIRIRKTKNYLEKSFIVNAYSGENNLIEIYRKYAALRPKKAKTNRFFLQYRNLKCTLQVIGINTFGKIPSEIATFLKLEDPSAYTGHCFRRSSVRKIPNMLSSQFTEREPSVPHDSNLLSIISPTEQPFLTKQEHDIDILEEAWPYENDDNQDSLQDTQVSTDTDQDYYEDPVVDYSQERKKVKNEILLIKKRKKQAELDLIELQKEKAVIELEIMKIELEKKRRLV